MIGYDTFYFSKQNGHVIRQVITSFTETVSCGNEISAPSCNLCPKTNGTIVNAWCNGNCFYDEERKTCRECKET